MSVRHYLTVQVELCSSPATKRQGVWLMGCDNLAFSGNLSVQLSVINGLANKLWSVRIWERVMFGLGFREY